MLVVTALQLVFWLGIYARLGVYRSAKEEDVPQEALPLLSVLIAARNEAENLQHNLPAVLKQDYPSFEVLVIDDDSSDCTQIILKNFQDQYPILRVLRISPKTSPGKKSALQLGISNARGEWLVFTDADCRPASAQWLRHLAIAMRPILGKPTEIVLGYGPLWPQPGPLARWARFETVYTAMQYAGFALAGIPYMGVGRNLAWRRSLFDRVGGFAAHADLASGDDDLFVNAAAKASNTKLCFEARAFVYSRAPSTWVAWMRQKHRHLSAGVRYRPLHRALLAAAAASHVLHYALVMAVLWKGALPLALLCWGGRMLVAGVVFSLVARRLHESDLSWRFPLLDAGMALYWGIFVPGALVGHSRPVSWR